MFVDILLLTCMTAARLPELSCIHMIRFGQRYSRSSDASMLLASSGLHTLKQEFQAVSRCRASELKSTCFAGSKCWKSVAFSVVRKHLCHNQTR